MKSTIRAWPLCLALGYAWMAPAAAETLTPAPGLAFVAQPVDAAALETYRGGTQNVSNDMTLAGTTADNTAHHITTGTNTIGSGAFSSMSGIPVVIQNSGANVLIQNALIVHMQLD